MADSGNGGNAQRQSSLTCGQPSAGDSLKLCKNPAGSNTSHPGQGPCHYHERFGIRNFNFKYGKYATLPDKLLKRYEAAQEDPTLMSLRTDIALIDARLSEIVETLDTGGCRVDIEAAQAAFSDVIKQVHAGGKLSDAVDSLAILELTLDRIATERATWDEILRLLDNRRKLVDSERRWIVEMKYNITLDQMMVIVARLTLAIKTHVEDEEKRKLIGIEIGRLLQAPENYHGRSVESIDD